MSTSRRWCATTSSLLDPEWWFKIAVFETKIPWIYYQEAFKPFNMYVYQTFSKLYDIIDLCSNNAQVSRTASRHCINNYSSLGYFMFKHFWACNKCLHWWRPSFSTSCALSVRHAECFRYLASTTIATGAVCNGHCRLIPSWVTVVALMAPTGVHSYEVTTAFFSDLIPGRIFLAGSGGAIGGTALHFIIHLFPRLSYKITGMREELSQPVP